MKAKKGYSGLESFTLSFSTKGSELLTLSGNDAEAGIINELLDSGREEEARRMLRKTLAEMTRDLDTVLDGKKSRRRALDGTCKDLEVSPALGLER